MRAKRLNPTLMKNEDLRPWTTDPKMEGLLRSEMNALERTITYIAPQMNAGKLGSSILDGDVPGVREFESSIKAKTSQIPIVTKLTPMDEQFFPLYVSKVQMNKKLLVAQTGSTGSKPASRTTSKPSSSQRNHSQQHEPQYKFAPNDSIMDWQQLNHQMTTTTMNSGRLAADGSHAPIDSHQPSAPIFGSALEDGLDDADTEKISHMQQSLYAKTKDRRAGLETASIRAVRFRENPLPAVLPIRQREYQLMKSASSQPNAPLTLDTSMASIRRHGSTGTMSPSMLRLKQQLLLHNSARNALSDTNHNAASDTPSSSSSPTAAVQNLYKHQQLHPRISSVAMQKSKQQNLLSKPSTFKTKYIDAVVQTHHNNHINNIKNHNNGSNSRVGTAQG